MGVLLFGVQANPNPISEKRKLLMTVKGMDLYNLPDGLGAFDAHEPLVETPIEVA